jgi:hypothetical protein
LDLNHDWHARSEDLPGLLADGIKEPLVGDQHDDAGVAPGHTATEAGPTRVPNEDLLDASNVPQPFDMWNYESSRLAPRHV